MDPIIWRDFVNASASDAVLEVKIRRPEGEASVFVMEVFLKRFHKGEEIEPLWFFLKKRDRADVRVWVNSKTAYNNAAALVNSDLIKMEI